MIRNAVPDGFAILHLLPGSAASLIKRSRRVSGFGGGSVGGFFGGVGVFFVMASTL